MENGRTKNCPSLTLLTQIRQSLAHVQQLASFLLAESASVKVFRGRWMVIRNKSQQLLLSLSAVADFPSLEQTELLGRDPLPNIVDTLKEGRELAKKCIELNYGGKLLMQSNLDAVITKIDLYLTDLDIVIKSGIPQKTTSVPETRGTNRSSKPKTQTRKIQVRDLFSKLKMGNADTKCSVLDSIVGYLKQNEKIIVMIAEEGDLSYLIHLLDASMPVARDKAAEVVSFLAQVDEGRKSLTAENAHAPLIRVLENGTPIAKEKASEALLELTEISDNALAVAARGGVSALVQVCKSGTFNARAMAAGCLRNLASNQKLWRCLAEEGAIPVLTNLVRGDITGTAVLAQEYAAEALENLSSGDDRLRLLIAKYRGLESMLVYLSRAPSPRAQELAIRALRNLSISTGNARALVSAGYLSQLGSILSTGSSTLQQMAASEICHLCSTSINVTKALKEAGSVIRPLARMLEEAESSMEKEAAAQALATLLRSSSVRKEFYKEEKGIPLLVQLLDPRDETVGKKFPMSALLALSRSGNCRKRILSAGARQHLEKLAEMEVAGAKKALDRIRGNKLLNLFKKLIT